MKIVLFFIFFIVAANLKAQKYALLDKRLAQPIRYTDTVTSNDNFNGFFPVEKKMLPSFINVLQEIEKALSAKDSLMAKQYTVGCAQFRGIVVPITAGDRLDYVLTSNCSNVKITMHICDAKLSNSANIFFIKTWIKYIHNYMK